ncbi:hypothetical protein ACTXT7_012978 [Hymenolepis weldensis]
MSPEVTRKLENKPVLLAVPNSGHAPMDICIVTSNLVTDLLSQRCTHVGMIKFGMEFDFSINVFEVPICWKKKSTCWACGDRSVGALSTQFYS